MFLCAHATFQARLALDWMNLCACGLVMWSSTNGPERWKCRPCGCVSFFPFVIGCVFVCVVHTTSHRMLLCPTTEPSHCQSDRRFWRVCPAARISWPSVCLRVCVDVNVMCLWVCLCESMWRKRIMNVWESKRYTLSPTTLCKHAFNAHKVSTLVVMSKMCVYVLTWIRSKVNAWRRPCARECMRLVCKCMRVCQQCSFRCRRRTCK